MSSTSLFDTLPQDWKTALADELSKPYLPTLEAFVAQERLEQTIFPAQEDVLRALQWTPLEQVKVLILGQDPYHGEGQAHGLSFSVQPGVRLPPSLRNIYKELHGDVGVPISKSGNLQSWAQQGVLLLNAVLTVRQAQPNSHKDKGWETFTDAVIGAVSAQRENVVFVLWGAYAQKKAKLIDSSKHTIIATAHPSPLSANNGFFGSRPFSRVNEALVASGQEPLEWKIS
jgi:uracil-DNA glycosylase